MQHAKIPENESERQAALDSYSIVNSLPEESFDDLTLIASQICDTPIALISLIDNDRQWFKSKFGLETNETPRNISFCGHAINDSKNTLQVKDAKLDPRFSDNPLVKGDLDISFYAGVPLVDSSNMALGTLCVIDQKPKELTNHQMKALEALARQVILKIEDRKRNEDLISEIDQKDENINDLKLKYYKLYQDAPDMMISVDPNTKKIVECNAVLCQRLGYSAKELLEKEIFSIYHPDCLDNAKRILIEFAKSGEVMNERLILMTKDGEKINISINVKAVKNEKGQILYSNSILRDIDELVSAENKLQQLNANLETQIAIRTSELSFQKERLELALEGTKDGILDWADIHSDNVWWSPVLYEMLGYERGNFEESVAFLIQQVHAEDHTNVSDAIKLCIETGTPFDLEFRLRLKNGRHKWFRGRANPIKDKSGKTSRITASITDINDKKELELELVKTKTFLRKVTDIAPSIIYVFDQKAMKNEYSNREIGVILGYSGEELMDMGDQLFPLLCHPDDRNIVFGQLEKIRALKNDESISAEYRMRHKNGKYVYLISKDTVFERDAEGNVTKHIGVATDITNVKEDHLKIARQSEILKEQNDEIKQFAYIAMHDMKNPIVTLEGHFNYLKTQLTNPSDEVSDSIEFIDEEMKKFQNTLEGLNNAIQIKEVSIREETVDLNPIINRLISSYQNELNDLNGKFNVHLARRSRVIGTHAYLESILMNLISNAVKYFSPNRNPIISINTEVQDDFLLLVVEDNGLGIDTQLHKQRLFKMFNRFHHHPNGSGMGLYLVKSMVEKLGGTIEIESEVDRGTKFSIRLKNESQK